jgi:hypothetical protein
MKGDEERINWLEKRMLSSGYGTELVSGTNPPMERVVLKTMVGSGPWQKEYKGFNLRGVIDKAMKQGE